MDKLSNLSCLGRREQTNSKLSPICLPVQKSVFKEIPMFRTAKRRIVIEQMESCYTGLSVRVKKVKFPFEVENYILMSSEELIIMRI